MKRRRVESNTGISRKTCSSSMVSTFFAPRRPQSRTKTSGSYSWESASKTTVESTQLPGIAFVLPKELPPLPSGTSWKSKVRFLTPNSWVLHVPRFCRAPRRSLFERFWKARPSQKHSLVVYGKEVLENRYSAMYATTTEVGSYTYSGSTRPCTVCDPDAPLERFILDLCASADAIVNQLLASFLTETIAFEPDNSSNSRNGEGDNTKRISSRRCKSYNACLVNWYTPEHTIGLHSDDEPQLDPNRPILTLSWGGPRRFLLRPKAKGGTVGDVHEFVLRDGDLFVMGGKCQDDFKHEIPKVRSTKDGLVGNRISWTIRCMRPKPGKTAAATAAAAKTKTLSTTPRRTCTATGEKQPPVETNRYSTYLHHTNESSVNTKRRKKNPQLVMIDDSKTNDEIEITTSIVYNPYTRARS